MASLDTTTYHTLVELAQRMDPDGTFADIVEVLNQTNEFVQDVIWTKANDKTSNLTTVRSALPSPSIRRINLGVTPVKSTTKQIRDVVMMTEAWSEVDERLVRISDDPAAYRYSEDLAFVEAFAQAVPGYFIYGDGADEEISGLATRYATVTSNVLSLSGTGSDLTSIWIVQWGRQVHGIYPAGSTGGLAWEDKGLQTKSSSTYLMDVYRTKFQWDFGLVVKDDSSANRHPVQRICNVDTSSIASLAAASLPGIDDALIYALNHMPNRGAGAVIYGNADLLTIFDRLAKDKSNVWWGTDMVFGKQITTFQGHPVRVCDQILSTETALS